MKILIRTAAGLVVASFVAVFTSCGPNPVMVHDVYRYHHYDHNDGVRYSPSRYGNAPSPYGNASSYYGNVGAPPSSSAARSFEPVERF